ncbi:MAG: hypothetical protein CM15mP76_13650 [Prochlorococcus sp.]|nr:MAG: hypothetical protein CM15mP76_13650 [Prochlorococcus sp.]
MKITEDSIKAGINIIWTKEGIIDEKSETIAKNAGVTFVMNESPKKSFRKLNWIIRNI